MLPAVLITFEDQGGGDNAMELQGIVANTSGKSKRSSTDSGNRQ